MNPGRRFWRPGQYRFDNVDCKIIIAGADERQSGTYLSSREIIDTIRSIFYECGLFDSYGGVADIALENGSTNKWQVFVFGATMYSLVDEVSCAAAANFSTLSM